MLSGSTQLHVTDQTTGRESKNTTEFDPVLANLAVA